MSYLNFFHTKLYVNTSSVFDDNNHPCADFLFAWRLG